MAHIFKHKESDKLYTIEYLKKDIRFLNGGANEGIYATPYKWEGKSITHKATTKRYENTNGLILKSLSLIILK